MNLKTKALGPALIAAVLAIAAMSVPAAQAKNITAGAYPATLTMLDLNTEHGKLTRWSLGNGARFFECTTASLAATISGPTTAVTITPSYSGCFAMGLTESLVIMKMNSCDYVFEASETEAQTRIVCEKAGDVIETHLYGSHMNYTNNKATCTQDIPPQGPITGIAISHSNVGTATEDLVLNLNGMAKFNVTNTLGGLLGCGAPLGATTGSLKGELTVTGFSEGAHTKVMVE